MKIVCPFCQAAGKIDRQWQDKKIRCPKCQQIFVATNGAVPVDIGGSEVEPEGEALASPVLELNFSGQASEFGPIWMKNMLLTLVSFGIYLPWAKVRSRAYFYRHTAINNSPFAYRADPFILLRGYVLLFVGVLIYAIGHLVVSSNAYLFLAVLALVWPFILYKSYHYLAYNSLFGGARFSFRGRLGESYLVYLLLPLLVPLSLGLILPYWDFCHKRYFLGKMAFGAHKNEFTAKVSYFYGIYLRGLLLLLAIVLPLGGLFVALGFAQEDLFPPGLDGAAMAMAMVALLGFCYLGLALVVIIIQQYITARLRNYCWQNSQLGQLSFVSTLRARDLMWLRFSNIVAVFFSLGLLFPWAKIRRTRYLLAHLQLQVPGEVEQFLGEEQTLAPDRQGLEIGL